MVDQKLTELLAQLASLQQQWDPTERSAEELEELDLAMFDLQVRIDLLENS